MKKIAIILKDTQHGLWHENSVLAIVLEAWRYEIPGDVDEITNRG